MSSEALRHDATVTLKNASLETLEVDLGKMSLCDSVVIGQTNVLVSNFDTNTDDDREERL